MVPPIRHTLTQLIRLPARVWLLLLAVSAVIAVIVRPAAQWSIMLATDRAGGVTATPAGFVTLLGDPVALAGMATAAGLTLAATLGWAVLVLAVADHRRADRRPSVRTVLRGVRSAAPRLLRPGILVTGLQLAVLQPLAGTTVFAPITGGLAVPPFIGREFLKAPLSAALWCSLAALVVFVSFRVVLAPAFTVVAGEGPIRGLLSSLRVTRSAGLPVAGQIAVLLVGSAIARVLVVWSSTPLVELIPSEQLRAVVDVLPVLVLSALTVVTAQAVAFSVVATVQSARGIASPIGERVDAPGPTSRRIVAVVMVVVVGCTALLVPSRAVSQPVGVHRSTVPLVIAHRGYDRGGPENTIAGLEAAAALHPDRVEVDVQQTGDGTFVASHDTNLLVLAGRDEDIDTMTTAAVTSTTVRMHGNAGTIPTMSTYVSRARELGVPLLIELKATPATDDRSVAELFAQLDSAGPPEDTWFHSLDQNVVRQMLAQRPEQRIGLTVGPHLGPLPDLPVSFYTVEQASVTSAVIRSAHLRGREVYAWTANSDVRMRVMLRAGLDGVVTDRPVAARALVARVAQERPGAPGALRDELSSCCRVP
ncbi:glycerophosphodiester phosphodiesterase family protein [Curtobacterium sp. MCBD17_026]|uniref:glycerophosphodiester phosphodiesterase family protein n=1 Tax=Curtobacterium sp. MCBD17_026 TaxID=2175621 RepID=UPI000DAA4774|nr:glycerophosphodiester phosphodiesterase family protein [Curtobacterium sp. MCBD17_026]WIB71194.1 glycerophosphodiester phosphodiesterase family protein [Curtobacterium sp. MCBD17_026]